MELKNYFSGVQMPAREVAPGVARKVLAYGEALMVCELHFQKGAVGALHAHPHSQCTYILSGAFEFDIGGEKKILTAGDSTYKQPGVLHGAVCLEEGSLLDIFAPHREDFLI